MTTPQRTCVGCRARRPKAELLWLRRRPDAVVEVRSPRRPRSGRGAYLCPTPACITAAHRHGSLARSFRARVRFDHQELLARLETGGA